MSDKRQFCAICAWRENCAKKFSMPDGGTRCPDFTRDISIKVESAASGVEKADTKKLEE
jgi:hypothetical protein